MTIYWRILVHARTGDSPYLDKSIAKFLLFKIYEKLYKKAFIYFHASHEGMSSPIWPILKEERSIKRRADFRGGVGGGGRGREGVCRGRGWGGAGERAYIFILVGRRSELNRRKS